MDHLYSPVMVLKFPWTSSLKSSSVIPHRFSHFLKQERNMKGYLERYPETTLIGVNDRSGRERKRRKKVDRKGNQKQQRKISPNQESNKIDKWLYFFEFIFCKRPNLPLLLHRFSAMLYFFFVGDILIYAQR